ncbi:ATP-binding cassette domain-containing protein [Oenococcus alcoholitolerans]|uniref:ABC transporter ATP-binding protein n=1 Tax=Oenococcus alcoholitolerans TaxID=931074 RepID=UPI003F703525
MEKIFVLKKLSYKVKDRLILNDLNYEIEKGAFLTITGPSGSGKSTFLRILATLLTKSSGTLLFKSRKIEEYSKIDYRRKVSYLFQQPQLFGEKVIDSLSFPFQIRNQQVDMEKIEKLLSEFSLKKEILDQSINDVSGGEKQRISLIRSLIYKPEVLLLDEVTTGLDTLNKDIVHKSIRSFNENEGITILSVTHDENEIKSADKLLEIIDGRIKNAK